PPDARRVAPPRTSAMTSIPNLPETPLESLGPLARETVVVGAAAFRIDRPADSSGLIHDSATGSAFARDDDLPFWADLWPASRMLAKAVLRQPWTPGLTALELGCGLGLPGVAALARGLRVIFSDRDRTALRFAGSNAALNGYTNFD